MTQQNAALVEESSAAAQSLREQATRLAGAVQVFKLSPGDGSGGAQMDVAALVAPGSRARVPAQLQ
ncbi:Methyl-accepting chemotaxis protein III [compost metagenome]